MYKSTLRIITLKLSPKYSTYTQVYTVLVEPDMIAASENAQTNSKSNIYSYVITKTKSFVESIIHGPEFCAK